MKARQLAELNQARNDHLDIHVWCVVAQINQTESLWSKLARAMVTDTPVVDHRRVESRFVKFVLDKEAPVVEKRPVNLANAPGLPFQPAAERLLPGKIP